VDTFFCITLIELEDCADKEDTPPSFGVMKGDEIADEAAIDDIAIGWGWGRRKWGWWGKCLYGN
jgi:hypothetical protein